MKRRLLLSVVLISFLVLPIISVAQNTGGWKVSYARDEFDEPLYNFPYIYQIWEGRWNNRLDCGLGIKIASNHIMLTIVEDYSEPNLSGVKVTAQLNGQKVNIDYDDIEGSTVIINTEENYIRLIRALETKGTIKFSFRRTDSFDSIHNYLFTLYGPTHVTSAMKKHLK